MKTLISFTLILCMTMYAIGYMTVKIREQDSQPKRYHFAALPKPVHTDLQQAVFYIFGQPDEKKFKEAQCLADKAHCKQQASMWAQVDSVVNR